MMPPSARLGRSARRLMVAGIAGLAGCFAAYGQSPLPAPPAALSSDDSRFGLTLGAGSTWISDAQASGASPSGSAFFGGSRRGASTIDYNRFLQFADPRELLRELRSSLLSGAQAEASNFMLMLAYANPTIASTLDMTDKRYSDRYAAFAQSVSTQGGHPDGQGLGTAATWDAGEQCFDQLRRRDTAPTEAYRRCHLERDFAGLGIPAAASNADFFRSYARVKLRPSLEPLLQLLPDQRIQDGQLQARAPAMSTAQYWGRLQASILLALERMDSGTGESPPAVCAPDAALNPANHAVPCIPAGAKDIVGSASFRATRLLGPGARALFKDALSRQIATAELLTQLAELRQSVDQLDVVDSPDADAQHVQARRKILLEGIQTVLTGIELERKNEAARLELVHTQMASVEHLERAMDQRSAVLRKESGASSAPLQGLLNFLANGN